MKIPLLIGIVLISNLLQAQRNSSLIQTSENEIAFFEYNDFVDNHIKSIEAYSFKINKKGRVKNDSTRLFVQILDMENNQISGINYNVNYQSHGPLYLTWYKFKKHYDKDGRLIKRVVEPLNQNRRKEYGSIKYDVNKNEELFFYTKKGKLAKEIYNRIESRYSISKYTKDTFHLLSIRPTIYETYYDDLGRESERYHTDDSTRYLTTNSYIPDSSSVNCFYCDSRYLIADWKYGKNGELSIWTSYTKKGEFHTKRYFFYDDENRIIQRIDSTGWYINKHSNEYPKLESKFDYFYTDSILSKIVETNNLRKREIEYNLNGDLIKECTTIDSKDSYCTIYNYQYVNNLLKQKITTLSNEDVLKIVYSHDGSGLIKEERQYRNEKLINLVKYKYWKTKKY